MVFGCLGNRWYLAVWEIGDIWLFGKEVVFGCLGNRWHLAVWEIGDIWLFG